jgi:pyruvate/2-oxoglutarate dehydrogenase complex dihydrolipoamide dehydrogenase (E3) component
VKALDSTSIMELQELPEHLLVLGGGYVGLEFGQMFRRFGSAVTIVQHGKQLLGREDPDVAEEVCKLLEADGIEILLETEAVGVHASASGVGLDLRGPTGERTITGSHLLLATGRVPNSDQLNLAAAGVKVDARGFIPVDDRLQTNVAGIYALGDVKGGPAFTHISYDDYRIIRNNLLRGGQSSTRDRLVPYTVYIDPQLGRIGLTEQEARAQGRAIRVAKIPTAGSPAQWKRPNRAASSRPSSMPRPADPWGRRPGRRRRRDHVDASDRHDGQASLHRARRRHLRAPAVRGGIEHVVHEHGKMNSQQTTLSLGLFENDQKPTQKINGMRL